jgi:hypothetical protein
MGPEDMIASGVVHRLGENLPRVKQAVAGWLWKCALFGGVLPWPLSSVLSVVAGAFLAISSRS